jgi:COP9 signalosome complex subunit 6
MSVSIQLHPLAVMNISDHFTRSRYMTAKDKLSSMRVVGALLGRQQGRVMEIVNTVEVDFKNVPESEGAIKIDERFCMERLEAYKKIFPDLDCIGWYCADTRNIDLPSNPDVIVQ